MIEFLYLPAIGAGFFISLCVSALIVVTKGHHGHFSLDGHEGVQKFHSIPTPRVGGIAISAGFVAVWFFLEGEIKAVWMLLGLAGLLPLIVGLIEDISHKAGVTVRLVTTILGGAAFSLASGYYVTKVSVWGLDTLLGYPAFALAFTAIGIGGIANSVNIVDGFHGLASGTLLIILAALAIVGLRVDDMLLVGLALTIAAIIAGFMVVNFPLGKLFLGDAGAYFGGYLVAALAVMLPFRNPEVSQWISILILAYPITEMAVSIVRKMRREGHHPGKPDSLHLHMLVYRNLTPIIAAKLGWPTSRNPLTSVLLWSLPAINLLSVTFFDLGTFSALTNLAVFVSIYMALYLYLIAKEEGS